MSKVIELDRNFYSVNTCWWESRKAILKSKYMNNEIYVSPYIHKKVYGEIIDNDIKKWNPSIQNHIMILWGPAGNINTNDYRYIPIEMRKLFWNIVSKFTVSKQSSATEDMYDFLKNSYGITDGLADILVWYYLSGEPYRSILKNDSIE